MQTQILAPSNSQRQISSASLLRQLEGLAILGAALAMYTTQGFGWGAFVLFLLAPDLAALGYLASTRVGNTSYNLVHSLVGPLLLAVVATLTGQLLGLQIALIWLAHIGMDRAIGYGLKEGGAGATLRAE